MNYIFRIEPEKRQTVADRNTFTNAALNLDAAAKSFQKSFISLTVKNKVCEKTVDR